MSTLTGHQSLSSDAARRDPNLPPPSVTVAEDLVEPSSAHIEEKRTLMQAGDS